jgi:hypothetical protein
MRKANMDLHKKEEEYSGWREDSPSPTARRERLSESLPLLEGNKFNKKPVLKTIEVMDSNYLQRRTHRSSTEVFGRCKFDRPPLERDVLERHREADSSCEDIRYQEIDMTEPYDVPLDKVAYSQKYVATNDSINNIGTPKRKLSPPLDETGVKAARVGGREASSSLLNPSYLLGQGKYPGKKPRSLYRKRHEDDDGDSLSAGDRKNGNRDMQDIVTKFKQVKKLDDKIQDCVADILHMGADEDLDD